MGFGISYGETSPPKQESSSENNHSSNKLVVGAGLALMASSSNGDQRSTQFILNQQQQQQQQHHHQQNQHLFQNPHHLHHHRHHHQHQHHQHQQQQNNQISFGMMQASSSANIPNTYLNRDTTGGMDMVDMDPSYYLYMENQDPPPQIQEQRQNSGMRPPTLNIFPSQPMHVETPPSTQATDGVGSPSTSSAKRPLSEPSMEPPNPGGNNVVSSGPEPPPKNPRRDQGKRKGVTSSSEHDGPKTPDPKTLRRLAQNREAARKSRLRKKAYVQQLESSRIRLTQLEQELQRARAQGFYFGGSGSSGGEQGPVAMSNISSDAAVFDVEYNRWLDEHKRLMHELRAVVQEHISENDLRMYVENCLAHYDQVLNLKGMIAKSDVFHVFSGMWKTPAERCFMWMGGFRPSELIKVTLKQLSGSEMILGHIEPLTEQQLMGICALQQSTQGNEENLNHAFETFNQNVSDTIAADALGSPLNMANYTNQMVVALNKLGSVETLLKQADLLRRTTLHQLHQLLTTRQAARCFLAISEYFHRLRALSSLWSARPRQE